MQAWSCPPAVSRAAQSKADGVEEEEAALRAWRTAANKAGGNGLYVMELRGACVGHDLEFSRKRDAVLVCCACALWRVRVLWVCFVEHGCS